MTIELLAFLLLALIGVALSALFSGMETGLYTINRVRLAVRAGRGETSAVRLRSLINRPNRMLSTLLIGNNAANYAGSFGIAAILDLYGIAPISAILINVALLVSLLFVFGETLPKDLFRTHTDHWSYALSGFLTWCARIITWTGLGPVVEGFGSLAAKLFGASAEAGALPNAARQRISHLIKEGVAVGVLSEHQTTLADRALALRELRVAGEMVPWGNVVAIPADASPQQRREVIERHHFTRFPVVEREIASEERRVIGVIATLDALLEPDKPTRERLQPAIELEARTPVREALRRMRESGGAMAVVVRRAGGPPIGIVTFTDLLEPLTGEMRI